MKRCSEVSTRVRFSMVVMVRETSYDSMICMAVAKGSTYVLPRFYIL